MKQFDFIKDPEKGGDDSVSLEVIEENYIDTELPVKIYLFQYHFAIIFTFCYIQNLYLGMLQRFLYHLCYIRKLFHNFNTNFLNITGLFC